MANDVKDFIRLEQAAAMLVGRSGRPHIESLRRWCRRGRKMRDGSIVKLKSVTLSGTRWTTRRWVEDFAALCLLAGMG